MKKIAVMITALMLMLFITVPAGASNLTAKSFAMGGAFTGVADDISAVLYNPAGLSQSGLVGIYVNGGTYASDFGKIADLLEVSEAINNDDVVEVYKKFPDGAYFGGQAFVGGNFRTFGVSINTDSYIQSTQSGTTANLSNTTTTEGIVTFSNELLEPPLNLGALYYGVNLKFNRTSKISYDVDNINVYEKMGSGTGYGLDIGVLAKVTDFVKVGAQVRNLVATEYEVTGDITEYTYTSESWESNPAGSFSEKVKPGRTMRVGAAVHIPVVNATVAADIENFPLLTEDENAEQIIHLGFEKNLFFNALSLRAGTFEKDNTKYYTGGIGLNFTAFHLDLGLGKTDEDTYTALLSGNIKF
ncbi:hypothetical protein [Halothermothrix orenii]|uniref:Membrane protein involved in aromatic hydrocarbon degradation n=1 Tax=Halothermothrix orenii (strain H 168 / OCM 544 / DSM 9562) TaxID=373903 RepID=B8CYW4_HALOH|nr:hypothetical protein [Halothermothrix orenii]ACL70483.1 hypothetical protein Hore_17340 [Halothermothrix orenii H 168]